MTALILAMQLTPGAPPPPYVTPSPASPPAMTAPPSASAPPVAPKAERDVTWFARLELGLGTRGFAENNALLDEVGYASAKMWATMDVAWMIHRRIGGGLWMGMNRRASSGSAPLPDLNAASYFLGGEVPILLWGRRAYSFHLTPRLGFLAGRIELDDEQDSSYQNTAIFGGALGFQTFTYHTGLSVGFLHAPVGAPGELGRNHDYGGFYATLSGTIDG